MITDNDIKQIIHQNLKISVKKPKDYYDLSGCLYIDEVAPKSIAAELGICPGDMFIEINGRAAMNYDRWQWAVQSSGHRYVIYQPEKKQELLIDSTGIPLGVDTSLTSEAILKSFKQWDGDWASLNVLWNRCDWDVLKSIVDIKKRGPATLWGKLRKVLSPGTYAQGELDHFYRGISLYEQGEYDAGMALIDDFAENHVRKWTMDYAGKVMYYRARELERKGDEQAALELLTESYDYSPQKPVKQAVVRLGGQAAERESAWLGKPFPLNYHLPLWLNGEMRSLEASLNALAPGQILTLCNLGSYRSNGPYYQFMQRYTVFHKYFPRVFANLQVTTSATKAGNWDEAEDIPKKAGVPFEVLSDKEDAIAYRLDMTRSPDVYLLDRGGTVIYNSTMDSELDCWKILSLARN